MRADSTRFTIIGIMKPVQNNPFVFQDLNNGIIVPLKTPLTPRSDATIDYLLLKLKPNSNIDQVQQQLSRYLKGRNPQQRLIFHSAKRLIEGMVKQKKVLTLFLGFIGGISLLVGGIGVMNIMLVSVTERRQEIGIRMAIGARRYDIQLLFLIEAVTLSIVGGLLGILCGIIVTAVIAELNHWDFTLFSHRSYSASLFLPQWESFLVGTQLLKHHVLIRLPASMQSNLSTLM